jgi:hypothetical protein
LPVNHLFWLSKKEKNMKRVSLWTIGIWLFLGMELLTVAQAYTEDQAQAPTCTLATLKGRYLFVNSGTLFPPAFGVTAPSLFASAGYHIFNGDGTGTDVVTFIINGKIVLDKSAAPISYTLKPDCTGTYKVLVPSGPSFDIFVAPNGEEVAVIGTDLGVVGLSPTSKRSDLRE